MVDLDKDVVPVVDKRLIESQRMELVQLLSAATDGWIEFMDKVGQFLGPIVRAAGKPSKAELVQTMVGALGFKSWKEMIEADLLVGGLGWKFSTYQQWRKAYVIVNAIDGLRESRMPPAELIRKAKVIKDSEQELPDNAVEFEQLFTTIQDDAKATSIGALKSDIERLQEALNEQVELSTETDKKLLQANTELWSSQDKFKVQAERLADYDIVRAELKEQQDIVIEQSKKIAELSVIIQTKDDETTRLKNEHNSAVDDINKKLNKAVTAKDEFETELDVTCDKLTNTQSELSVTNDYKNKLVKYLNLPFWKKVLEKKPEAPRFKPKKR